jgi:hypothetical protein
VVSARAAARMSADRRRSGAAVLGRVCYVRFVDPARDETCQFMQYADGVLTRQELSPSDVEWSWELIKGLS